MRKLPVPGGWLCEPSDLEEYRAQYLGAELMLRDRYFLIPPYTTEKRIAWEQNGLKIMKPAVMFFHMLRVGGYVREMRVIDEMNGVPVFDGSGELLPSLTEDEALAFIAWRDIPRGVNRWSVVRDLPPDNARVNRSEWYLNDDGVIVVPDGSQLWPSNSARSPSIN